MSYSKKDEDADQAIVKVDRTAVFQEGALPETLSILLVLTKDLSSTVQLLSYLAAKMSNIAHQNRSPPLYGGELPAQRSHRPLLRHLEAFSEQGSFSTANDVPHIQRISNFSIRRDHDDSEYHERHRGWK